MIPAAIQEAFLDQSDACAALGSPFMGRLMALCGTMDWPAGSVTDRIFAWQGDISPRGQSVPLRLAGALHALHLQGHAVLGAVYPPQTATDADLWDAVSDTFLSEADHINTWLESAPQTNEVRRSATLIAVGHLLAERFRLADPHVRTGGQRRVEPALGCLSAPDRRPEIRRRRPRAGAHS